MAATVLVFFLFHGTSLDANAQAGPAELSPAPIDASNLADAAELSSLLIGVEPGLSRSEIEQLLLDPNLEIVRVWPELGIAEARVVGSSTRAATEQAVVAEEQRAKIAQASGVRFADYNARIYAADLGLSSAEPPWVTSNPNDPRFGEQWAMATTRVVESWNISRGDPNVVIAVIDSGYDINHEDIDGDKLWVNLAERDGVAGVDDDGNGFIDDIHGWDWVENDDTANDPAGHGTHVGGAIAATIDNHLGVAGLAPNHTIMPLRVLDENGSGNVADLIDAIEYARLKGVDVGNMSLVLSRDDTALHLAVEAAYAADLLIVAAAGNFAGPVDWPAAYSQTLAVASTDSDDDRSSFSNFGPQIDVAAPGSSVLSTYKNGGYFANSGTSMATPHVAALAALVRGLRPDHGIEDVRSAIRDGAVDVNAAVAPGVDDYIGAGRIDFYATLLAASQDLMLDVREPSGAAVFPGAPMPLQISVSAPGGGSEDPVAGAIVHYQLVADPTAAVDDQTSTTPISGFLESNVDGLVETVVATPTDQGSYVLRAQVGSVVVDTPLLIQQPPGSIQLSAQATSLVAGDSATTIRLEIRDEDGALTAGNMPVTLSSDAGALQDGSQRLALTVTDGVYEGPFYGGVVADTATITADVATLSANTQINILPAGAALLSVAAPILPIQTAGAGGSAQLIFEVRDAFGNLVADTVQIQLSSDVGSLSPTELTTVDGHAVTTFSVPAQATGVANIWAMVPGTPIQLHVTVPLNAYQLFVPLVGRE